MIVRSGKRLRTPGAVIHIKRTETNSLARFGFVVSKTVGKAHVRNLIRRRYKAIAWSMIQGGLSGVDVVVRTNPISTSLSFNEIKTSTQAALQDLAQSQNAEA